MPEPPVVNASPFIILAVGGRLDLLRYTADRIVVPRPVEREVLQRGITDAAVSAMRTLDWIEVVDLGEPPEQVRQYHLDAGEEAVLTWALAHPGTLTIIDDRRGRRAARALGVLVTGTLGLIVEAKLRGLIPAARPVAEHLLRTTGWYLAPGTLESALADIGE